MNNNRNPNHKSVLGFVSHNNDFKFLDQIISNLSNTYTVQKADYRNNKSTHTALGNADIIWVEWATDIAVRIPQMYPKTRKILRIHSMEAYTRFPKIIPWHAYSDVIFVADFIRKKVEQVVPDLKHRTRTHIVPNGIDLGKFKLINNSSPYNLAFVALLRHVKNLPFLIQCFNELYKFDRRYRLHVAGEFECTDIEGGEIFDYLKHIIHEFKLNNAIQFDGFINDMSSWFEDKNFIISTSIRESQGVNIAEGMSKGLKPIIHNFPAAREHYPKSWLFNTSDEFVKLVVSGNKHPEVWRNYVLENFNIQNQIQKIIDIIDSNKLNTNSKFNCAKLKNSICIISQKKEADKKQQDTFNSDSVQSFCPICRKNNHFLPFGAPQRLHAMCPECTSLERHRALWNFLAHHTDFLSVTNLRLLHFAPEVCFESKLRKLIGTGYVTADLLDPRADVRTDITELNFFNTSFDVILCSHVLEHITNDRKAMRELHRVLTNNGVAIILVPLKGKITEEDLSITDPVDRLRRYGQADHVRHYGLDIVDRLQEAGFSVDCVDTNKIFACEDIEKMRLGCDKLIICRKHVAVDLEDYRQDAVKQINPASKSNRLSTKTQKKIARHWATSNIAPRTRWWMHPAVLRHVNSLVCGIPVEGPWTGLTHRMREISNGGGFERGLSVGCGNAAKELRLLQDGLVGSFDLFEITENRVAKGKTAAKQYGVESRAHFRVEDAFSQELANQYDLVYWNNALHHMFDVTAALEWSRERLRPGGFLVMDDFVGATRFQWPDVQLQIATKIRRSLPKRLLRSPTHPEQWINPVVRRPSVEEMLASDPSEAADSENILPALRKVFPQAEIVLTGGVIYHLTLNDVITNFEDTQDAELLQTLLDFDADLASHGQTHYASAFACKN